MDRIAYFRSFFIRNIEMDRLFDNFFVSAITSILLVRFLLHVSDYPQLGGRNFHVAHMLWGGMFMTVAIVMLLTYVSRSIKDFSSVIGGVGFGIFIDELGKFITRDNNYFYQPAVAVIYVIFILLYLSLRAIEKHKSFTKEEYLINGLEMVKEAVMNDMNMDEKKRAIEYLEKSGARNKFITSLKMMLIYERTLPISNPHFYAKIWMTLKRMYHHLVDTKWFLNAVIGFYVIKSIIFIITTSVTLTSLFRGSYEMQIGWVEFLSSLASGVLVVLGTVYLRRSRLIGYTLFKRSVLISIFLTQVFAFYHDQFSALVGLGLNIFLLITLDYMIHEESINEVEIH